MPGATAIPIGYWAAFTMLVMVALAIDLGLFHRHGRAVGFREALGWTTVWFALAMVFGIWVGPHFVEGWHASSTAQFLAGYFVELSLSMDNVFVIAVVFSYFEVPRAWQHRVLFWGILGALMMRGILIWAGSELIEHFHQALYVMGAFLVYTGAKMAFAGEDADPGALERRPVVRLARRWLPFGDAYEGERFVTVLGGRRVFTPLFLVLLVVETTDVIFALDSIPAIFGITSQPFLVFTSNVFAILGLRSLYFVLASAMGYFRYMKHGLALVLVLIGAKMLAEPWLKERLGENLTRVSLGLVVGIILASMLFSVVAAWHGRRKAGGN